MVWAVSLSTKDLGTQRPSDANRIRRFKSLGKDFTPPFWLKSNSTPVEETP